MRVRGLRVLFVVGAAVGAILGTLEIALVAFADEVGAKSLSGVLIAGLAVGSMASGIGWGTVHWRLPLRHRLTAVLVLMTVLSVPLLLVQDVWLMVPFVVLAGVAVSPSLISSFTLAEVLVPRAAVTEAFTWIGTALGLGVARRPSREGRRRGGPTAFLVATVAAGVAAVVVALSSAAARPGRARVTPPWPLSAPGRRAPSTSCWPVRAGSTVGRRGRAARRGALLVDTRPSSSGTGTARCRARWWSTATSWSGGWTRPARPAPRGDRLRPRRRRLCNEGYSSSLVADTLRTLG